MENENFSEEITKRFNKKTLALSISLIAVFVLSGVLGMSLLTLNNEYNDLSGNYDDLYIDYLGLLNDFNSLDNQYSILTGEHIELENDYNILVIALADITAQLDALDDDLVAMTVERDALIVERDGLLQDIVERDATIVDLNSQITTLDTTIVDLNIQITDLNTQITNLEGENQDLIDYYEGIITGLNSEITALETERDGLIIALADMTSQRDALQILYDDLGMNYLIIETERNSLLIQVNQLQIDYDALQLQYDDLIDDYQTLSNAYAELQIQFDALTIAYDYICDTIRQSILPVQYGIFAEAVRRYYAPIYMEGLFGKEYWMSFAEFCRDIVLHDSWQYNAFSNISNAFSDALKFGNDTMYLADYTMYWTFWDWLPDWGIDLTFDELWGIDTIVDWCIDEIDYEYDSDITDGQEYFDYDYIKFPVETAFRTMGDCEDQAILTATYLESCGFETAIGIWHDPEHPDFVSVGGFYHGVCFVYIEDTDAFKTMFPDWLLWRMTNDPIDEYAWCMIDTTWDVPFGSIPTWFDYYRNNPTEFTLDDLTRAVCDVDGGIEANIGENSGLTCVMPT